MTLITKLFFFLLIAVAIISCGDDVTNSDPMEITMEPAVGYHGEIVTIKGKNFKGTISSTSVAFNSGSGTILSLTPTEIVAVVPYGTKTGLVSVSYNLDGTVYIHKSKSDFTIDSSLPKFTGGVRNSGVAFSINNKGYMGTGFASGSTKKDLWEMDPTTKVWTQKADFPGAARSEAFGFSIGSKGYIGGGSNNSPNDVVDFYEYDPSTNQWTAKASLSSEISDATAFVINGKGYIATGANSSLDPTTAVFEYDPALNQWTAKAAFPGAARIYASSFVINNKGYVTAGFSDYFVSTADDINLTDLWEYDPSNNSWTQKSNLPQGRVAGAGFTLNGKGYIGLGFLGKNGLRATAAHSNQMYSYNPSTNSWTQETNLKGAPRSFAFSFTIGNTAYIAGGNDYSSYYDDLRVYP